MDSDMVPLLPHENFCFSCHPEVECFNECCRDLNQFLTPYDILRLKNCLGLTSGEFLKRFTREHEGPETGLPVMALKPNDASNLICPFVTPSGCRVYEDRPSSCRTYPMARAITRNRETGRLVEHFALLREGHCKGFLSKEIQSPEKWIAGQEIKRYNEMNDMLLEIISLKNRHLPGPLDHKSKFIFRLGLYDIDGFRSYIFEKGGVRNLPRDKGFQKELQNCDEALLVFGHTWVRESLFGK
jgi:uncharacterized protein